MLADQVDVDEPTQTNYVTSCMHDMQEEFERVKR